MTVSLLKRNSNSGFLTIEFMFALVIGIGMSMILFAMTFTLGVVEVTQYVTFAAARSHAAANATPIEQKSRATEKFATLTSSKQSMLSFLYKQDGWFIVAPCSGTTCKGLQVRSGINVDSNFQDDIGGGQSRNREVFMGVSTPFQSTLLSLKLPLIGSTTDDPSGAFKTDITTILIREPSTSECQDYWNQARRAALKTLPSGKDFYMPVRYHAMEDNGC